MPRQIRGILLWLTECLLAKAFRMSWALHTGVSAYLITPQILSCCFAAVQTVIFQQFSLRINKGILFGIISKTVLFGRIGKWNCRDISSNSGQFQATVNRTGIISSIRSNLFH